MKQIRFLWLLLACAALSFTTYAQEERTPKTPEERALAVTAWMKTNLQLTPEQEGPVKDINVKHANLNEGLRTSTKTSLEKAKTVKANEALRDKELKKVLTPEQFKVYESKKQEMKKKFKEEAQSRRSKQ